MPIRGKKVGIVGFGSIELEIATRVEAFGCSIAYNSRCSKPSVPFPYVASVRNLAARSVIIIASCASTDETHHIINKDVLPALGKEGIVIDIGRRPLIDEKELVKCLVQGEWWGQDWLHLAMLECGVSMTIVRPATAEETLTICGET
ncbi:hypothetical protein ACLOJK_020854 [Asimina triloba]